MQTQLNQLQAQQELAEQKLALALEQLQQARAVAAAAAARGDAGPRPGWTRRSVSTPPMPRPPT